ncbi:MAG: DNA adenine methylase [Candidatus Pacebacteria bacterium]|nr:DNA adenine methylase [Candidatus Paceibacterota bacterium]
MRKPVNVASVPLRSPFRYPGGKTWLAPYIRAWLNSGSHIPALFIEPFAGGGICSLTVAFERLANYVLIAELDEDVAAVWKVMLYGQSEWLAKRILGFEISLENVKKALSTPEGTSLSLKEKAFQTVLRNRVQRGGIMAPGAGLIKSGENGRGIASRWYPETLARRIREIGYKRDTIGFYDGDGFDLITEHLGDEDCFIFADPPYTKAARRLYRHWQFNHRRLFELFCSCRGDFLVSYDNTEEIKNLADEFGFQARPVAMKNTHHAQMTELLIARNLDWLPKDT